MSKVRVVLLTALAAAVTCAAPPIAQAQALGTWRLGAGWATFGVALPSGAARNGLRVGALSTQTDIKTTWPDGSIRFAIVTARVAVAGDFALESAPAASGTTTSVLPAVAVQLTIDGQVWTASLASTPSVDTWLTGPLVREARSLLVPVAAGVSHPFLRVLVDARSYAGGGHRLDVTVENVLDVAEADEVTYDAAIQIDGAAVFSKARVVHPYASRWRRVVRTGGLAEATVTPDFAPFVGARAVPAYLASVVDKTSGSLEGSAFDVLGRGLIRDPLDGPGTRPELSPYPDWTARYVVHRRAEERAAMLVHGDLSGSWSIHVTEPDGVRLISIDDHPNYWFDWRAGPEGARNRLRGTRPMGEGAFHPSLAFVPYLVTGDRYYLDELKFWANYALLVTYQDPVTNGREGSRGLLAPNDVRGIAWALRTLADAAAYVPDADPYRGYFRQKTQTNLDWLDAYGVTYAGGPLDQLFAGKRHEDESAAPRSWVSPAEQQMLLWAIDRALDHGLAPGSTLRDRIARLTVRFLTDLRLTVALAPALAVGTQTPSRFQPTYYTTSAEIATAMSATPAPASAETALAARLGLLVANAMGVPGAVTRLDALLAHTVNGTRVGDLVQADAGWAISSSSDVAGAPDPPRNVRLSRGNDASRAEQQLNPSGGLPPDVRPMRLTVPRATTTPTLDGRINPDEWRDAVAVTGVISQFDGVAHARQTIFWMKYDAGRVYIAQRSSVVPSEVTEEPRQPRIWFEDSDSVAMFALAPSRPKPGAVPSHFQFRANVKGKRWQQEVRWEAQGVRMRYPQNVGWTSGWTAANWVSPDRTTWESEYSVPVSDMASVIEGAQWGVLLARDYPSVDQSAIVISNDWRFGPSTRFAGAAVYDNYRLESRYAAATFAAGAPAIQFLTLGDLARGRLAPDLTITNSAASPARVTAKVTVYAGGVVVHTEEQSADLGPSERKPIQLAARTFPSGTSYRLTIDVRDGNGRTLHQQDVPFRADYAADRGAPVPDVFFSGAHKERDHLYDLMTAYNPIRNTLISKVWLERVPNRELVARADVTVRRQGDREPLFTMAMPPFDDYLTDGSQTLPVLKPGVYQATARVWAKDGTLHARASELFIRYDHEKDLPWLGNTLGVSDKVLPPWTPIEVNADITEMRTTGRSYRIDGGGLPTSLVATGQELLAGPVRLEIVGDAGAASLAPARTLIKGEGAAHRAHYRGQLAGGGWTVSTEGTLDYDGYLRVGITLPASGLRASAIRLVVPLRADQATHMQSVANHFLQSVTAKALPPATGQLWHSGQQKDPTFKHDMRMGNFKPVVWIGNAARGLAFLADNDRGWVPDDQFVVPSIEIRRSAVGVELVLNLVARPFTFSSAREIVFSLQATPVKPLPDDFRQRLRAIGNTMTFVGADSDKIAMDGTYGLGYTEMGPSFPMRWDKNKAFRIKAEADGLFYTPYQAANTWISVLETDDPRAPGLQGLNLYGYLAPEISATYTYGDAVMTKTDTEYRLFRYQRWIKETGLQGVYFDNAYPSLGSHVASGQGYVIDLPDRPALHGKVQPGYSLTGFRDFLKRLRTVFVEEGKDPHIILHATHTPMPSVYAFADYMIEGEEWRLRGRDILFSEAWQPEELQASNPSEKWGLSAMFMASASPAGKLAEPQHFQNMFGYLMLHDSDVWEWQFFWPSYTTGGLDFSRRADFLPYWVPKVVAAMRTPRADVMASGWRQGNSLFVLVFNRSWTALSAGAIDIDLAGLGITAASVTRVTDIGNVGAKPPFVSTSTGARTSIKMDIEPHHWRVVRVDFQ